MSTPLTPDETRNVKRTMQYRKTWTCTGKTCNVVDKPEEPRPATLTIRAKDDRKDGPSNFKTHPEGHPLFGHPLLPSHLLTWDGMAEERGWSTDPVLCPACQLKLSVKEYKQMRRETAIASQ